MSSQSLTHCGIEVTSEQAKVIEHLAKHQVTVVSAGAGAGKTYTTVAAVLELLAARQVNADALILITFTNAAAGELRNRLQGRMRQQARQSESAHERDFWDLQRERLSAAFIGTIHGFCKQVLDLYGYSQGVAREASISMSSRLLDQAIDNRVQAALLSGNSDPVAQLVLNDLLAEYELRRLLKEIVEDARSRGLRLSEVRNTTRRQLYDDWQPLRVRTAELLCEVEDEYLSLAQKEQQLDASALLLKVDELLASTDGPQVIERLTARFRFMFIDEFQDTSETQARIASRLATRMRVVAVGDGKQAIYAFAGATQSLLTRFAQEHRTEVLPLSLSGRPSKPLLATQTALFDSMSLRFRGFDQPLMSSPRNLDPKDNLPHCVLMLAREDEVEPEALVARRIARLIGLPMQSEQGVTSVSPGDIVVLVRTNAEALHWADCLEDNGVPARSEGGSPLFRQPEVVGMYHFLQLLWRYPDDRALMEALPMPALKDVNLDDDQAVILSHGKQQGHPITKAFEHRYPLHAKVMEELRVQALTATVPQLLGLIEQRYGLKKFYRTGGDETAALALDRLRDWARRIFDSDQALTLPMFLHQFRLAIMQGTELRQAGVSPQEDPQVVRVMTIHRAKGMEFPIVAIPALQSNRAPTRKPTYMIDESLGLEVNLFGFDRQLTTTSNRYWNRLQHQNELVLAEEMRLFYVAVTRAQRLLLMLGSVPLENYDDFGDTVAQLTVQESWALQVERAREESHPKIHSWQHEVARAWPGMSSQGAHVVSLRRMGKSPSH
jgi:DNA helicase-2/ATP-dependent DNA helicase PcrA